MKIGVVVDNEFTNDIRVTNECDILSNNGHDIKVLCLNFGSYPKTVRLNNKVFVYRILISRKLKNILFALTNFIDIYSIWWSFKIKRFIIKHNIDIIHVHDLYMAKAAFIATKNTKIKLVLDLHENYPYAVNGYAWMHKRFSKYIIRPWKWKDKEGIFLSFPDGIVVLSDSFKSELLNRYQFLREEQFVVYPNVPNIQKLLEYKIDKEILNSKNDFVLFYFGAINKRRGIDLLFDSIYELSKQISNLKLLLIGPVDKAEKQWFERRIGESIINKHTTHYAWKDISLLPSYIMASNICLSPIEKNPQHESGIANKVFQYMLFEKPVIVSNCLPQESLIHKYNCGLSFQWNSVESFIDSVIKIYSNPTDANEMGKNGRDAVNKHFNNTVLTSDLLSLYK